MRTVSAREIVLISSNPFFYRTVWQITERKAPGQGIAKGPVLYFHRSIKSVLRKMVQKNWGEVSVFSLLFKGTFCDTNYPLLIVLYYSIKNLYKWVQKCSTDLTSLSSFKITSKNVSTITFMHSVYLG